MFLTAKLYFAVGAYNPKMCNVIGKAKLDERALASAKRASAPFLVLVSASAGF